MNYFELRQIIESSLPWWTVLTPSVMFVVFTIIHAALHKPRKLNDPRNKPAK